MVLLISYLLGVAMVSLMLGLPDLDVSYVMGCCIIKFPRSFKSWAF